MENYAAAKARLFEMLESHAVAVVNANDPWSARMVRDCRGRIIQFGLDRQCDYSAKEIDITAQGTNFVMVTPAGQARVSMQLIGRHNIANALTAAALVGEVCQLSVEQLAVALRTATGAPGRLQPVRCGQPFSVLVDYAHTDDALENVLSSLRPLTQGKLRVLFGCGGDRDRSKRPLMAKTAEKLADIVYITSDNPRTEDPQAIINEILSGLSADVQLTGATRCSQARNSSCGKRTPVYVEIDRRTAIERALMEAEPGDVVLLAGKGHENYQVIGTEKHHFDDVEEASRVLRASGHAAADRAADGLENGVLIKSGGGRR
jgi:UDP-N-acetylmuramoyl-L-alanyl-D-glutamate--2,6-diaminopimelate ligase